MSTKRLGAAGEALARTFLRRKGYRILDANYRSARGEIDIVCRDRGTVVFVEVKSRSSTDYGLPGEAVNARKQDKLRQLAQSYLIERRLEQSAVRFDVLSIVFDGGAAEVEHIPGAF